VHETERERENDKLEHEQGDESRNTGELGGVRIKIIKSVFK